MRAICVIGPSGTGKTTLVQALTGLEGKAGKAFTVMSGASLRNFEFMGDDWAVFDTPGGIESISQIGPILSACDAALLCVPAEAGAAVLSAPYLRLVEQAGLPTFVFINGIDTATDRVSQIVSALQVYCAHGIVLRQVPMRSGEAVTGTVDLISERAWEYHESERASLVGLPADMRPREQEARVDLLEHLADFDDHLLEEIIEDQRPPTDELYEIATRALQNQDLLPCLFGSARQGNGIARLMKSLRHEVPGVSALRDRLDLPADVLAVSCMADSLKHIGKAVVIRALSDGVSAGSRLAGSPIGGLDDPGTLTHVPSLPAGAFGLTIKSDHVPLGTCMSADGATALPGWTRPYPPALRRLVHPVHDRDETKLPTALARIAEIDPGLVVAQSDETGHLQVGIHGPRHERRLQSKLAEDFGIEVSFSDAPAGLRETVRAGVETHYRHRKQSGGAGQFADVVIDVEPRPRGSGFVFEEQVKGGAVPRNYIPAVEAGVREALAEGPAGHPVVDVGVILKDGKSHSVDSSDFAFRTAAKHALREALTESGTTVLQPIMQVEVHVPSLFAGDLVQIISGLRGQVQGFENDADASGWDVFRTLLPMVAEPELYQALASHTRGTSWFCSELDHYERVR